jgi:hypothetical protein
VERQNISFETSLVVSVSFATSRVVSGPSLELGQSQQLTGINILKRLTPQSNEEGWLLSKYQKFTGVQ